MSADITVTIASMIMGWSLGVFLAWLIIKFMDRR
jgi:hypothetical protein